MGVYSSSSYGRNTSVCVPALDAGGVPLVYDRSTANAVKMATKRRILIGIAAFLWLCAIAGSAHAYTVAGVGKRGFADFSKAIVFTGAACPVNAETIQTSAGAKNCAIPLKPVGDGSWVCTATVFPGANYTYYFEYRIPAFEDTNGWKSTTPGGSRNQDPVRDVTVPSAITEGYIFYHIFGDRDVRGKQGMAKQGASWDTELTISNPDVAVYRGVTDVDNTGDGDTGNFDNNNNFNLQTTQNQDTVVTIRWRHGHGGDGFSPSLEGAREFDTTSTATPYGFKILRARLTASSAASPITNLAFEDTIVNQVTGDTFWSPNRNDIALGWYDGLISFTDTSLPAGTAIGDSFVYAVLWQDAYGNTNDTTNQNFSGGNATFVRGGRSDVLFLVEQFDPAVVFPDGKTVGRVKVTPYVDGVPQPFRSFWTTVFLAARGG